MKAKISKNRAGVQYISACMTITNIVGEDIDWTGLSSVRIKIQLGSADELELDLPAQDMGGNWRPDMPAWQVGGTLKIALGYDNTVDEIQTFEIVSTTNDYGGMGDLPTMKIRAVSPLVRAVRNRNPRTFADLDDRSILDSLCSEYGWTHNINIDPSKAAYTSRLSKKGRVKEAGKSDLELLKTIANEAELGAPRLTADGELVMPEPTCDDPIMFVRGTPFYATSQESFQILGFSPSREGGSDTLRLSIVGWDPERKQFIEKVFEADEFGGDPEVVFDGPLSIAPIAGESSTRGLTLQVVSSRGWSKDERRDVLASGRFLNETDAASLARRWFSLREQLSRWATIEVEGHPGIVPYEAVQVDGDMAIMDSGLWLPTVVEHNLGDSGWTTRITAIRVVTESVVSATTE